MPPIRIGLLGASKIAPTAMIAPAKANPNVELRAIAARDPARAKTFAAQHGVAHAHESYAALIADPNIDLVYNSLPPKHHLEWTLAALRAGKHVLLEKPSGMNAAEAATMVAAAKASGRRLIEAFHYRYHPLFARVLQIIPAELGALKTAEAVFEVSIARAPGEIRYDAGLGGGALMDLGCYPLQWLRNVAREEPEIASASHSLDADGADISTQAVLRFPSGLVASLSCSMQPASGKPMAALKVTGTTGELTVLNPLAPQFGHLLAWKGADGKEFHETFPQVPTYDYQLDAVVSALADGKPLPTEGQDIVNTMRAIDAIKAAAQKGSAA
jgi:predicted dehydrogenase